VLARENRLTSAFDFKLTMKAGNKQVSEHVIIYLKRDEAQPHARFGFLVGKPVAGAVGRNLTKRRLRSIAAEILKSNPSNYSLVVRALPGSAELDWNRLREEVLAAFDGAFQKRTKA
jgi:ribonuclease P protein component